jgi:hypothetical protein
MAIDRFQAFVLLGFCAISGAVLAQQANPLIGKWRGVMHTADNYNMPFEFTYFPDSTFVQTMAVPPSRDTGTGSGIVYTRGQYRMTSDHSLELNVLETRLCPAGNGNACTPMPLRGTTTQAISFRMEGPDKVINTDNGQISYRVR